MPYKNPKHLTKRQRQRRRAGHVRRLEVTLSAESERDHTIAAFLDDLPQGSASEFIRAAIMAAIERETASESEPASEQFNAILAELSALREAVESPEPVGVIRITPQDRQPPPDDEVELTVKQVSGGGSANNFLASLQALQSG